MDGKKIFILILILAIIPSLANAMACSAKPACAAGETSVLELSAVTNAHGAVAGSGDYTSKVCCTGITGTTCGGNAKTLLRLSGNTNAHAESPEETTPAYSNACISGSPLITKIYLATAGQNCIGTDACVVTLSGQTNAHLADCTPANAYQQKICIEQSGTIKIKQIIVANPSYKNNPAKPLTVGIIIQNNSTNQVTGNLTTIIFDKSGTPIAGTSVSTLNKSFAAKADTTIGPPVTYNAAPQVDVINGLPDGIYSAEVSVTSDGKIIATGRSDSFSLINETQTASIPETNWLGAAVAALGAMIIILVFQKKQKV